MLKNFNKVHMIGIGGIGMSGIAEVLLAMNFKVSGSDRVQVMSQIDSPHLVQKFLKDIQKKISKKMLMLLFTLLL